MLDKTFDIAMILLPSGIVFLTTYYLVKNFLDHENRKRSIDLKLANQNLITPIRLQAYERMVLFLERINPSSMVMRLNKTGSAGMFQQELLKTVRSEFEHNLAQQIYITPKTWDAIIKAKEETIKLINVASTKVGADSNAMEFAQAVILVSSQLTDLPTKIAIDAIKKEISKEF